MTINKDYILECCIKDKEAADSLMKVSFLKKYGFDWYIKFLILICNLWGKRNINNDTCIFVNEIKNTSMQNNLIKTCDNFKKENTDCLYMDFYRFNRKDNVHIGYVNVLGLFFKITGAFLVELLKFVFKKNSIDRTAKKIIDVFEKCMQYVEADFSKLILMTDHHFFSSVIAMLYEDKSYVLQHGKVQNLYFYKPVRAGHFLAWGQNSKNVLADDKVIVAGTYKFDIKDIKKINRVESVLFCISTTYVELAILKIDALIAISKELGFSLKVKCHPGSGFEDEKLFDKYADTEIEFYKTENIYDLEYDIAVTENSTVIFDVLCSGKPCIMYMLDFEQMPEGYDYVLIARNKEELKACIADIDSYDLSADRNILLQKELNNGICNLVEIINGK